MTKSGFMEITVSPEIDYDCFVLKKHQRVPKGWKVKTLTADCFPAGWPPGKPYVCQCGCGKTFRIGDRFAYRNLRETGRIYVESKARVKP